MNLKDTIINQMNNWGKHEKPFLFIIDFLSQAPIIIPLEEVDPKKILYNLNGFTNCIKENIKPQKPVIEAQPESFETYKSKFSQIQKEIALGNTYLLNLTTCTPIKTNVNLKEIFYNSKAKYKLYYKDLFTCFSPETFIKIINNKIYSFPMKGTIDGNIPHAEKMILEDEKEISEHYTIVDLIRNDLNSVAENVKVDSFRYLDRIEMQKGALLQVSSRISGDVSIYWKENIGTIISKLLPAGSISGAPKERTVDIISSVENYPRGYYTGICGIFDGNSVDSAVMIRFIEKQGEQYFYKSGGGITHSSKVENEYKELIQKIYVPAF